MASTIRAVCLLALVSSTALAGCSGGSEQSILTQFFSASRLRDNTSLDNFATVIFDPRTNGTVTSFTVTNVSPEQRKPLPLKALARAQEDVKAEDESFTKRKEEYQNANPRSGTALVNTSVNGGGRTAIDVTKYDGEMVSKDVTISAPVRLPDGSTVEKTLVLTLQRAILTGDRTIEGRWVVTGFDVR